MSSAPADSPRERSRIKRFIGRALRFLALLVLILAAVTARVIISGERELEASTAALRAGDPWEATIRARRAARWYAPGAPHVRVAYDRLMALAEVAEERRRFDVALLAWRAVRTAMLESRWLLTPYRAELTRANREIARLSSTRSGNAESTAEIEKRQLAELTRNEAPRTLWVLALVVGFGLWFGGLVVGAGRLAGPAGAVRWKAARPAMAMVIVGTALWLVAIWRA